MGYTYTAHASSCAAALKNLDIIEEENLCAHIREVGPYLQQRAVVLGGLPIVGDVRGSHFMLGVELVSEKASKQSFDPSDNVTDRVFKKCIEKGVVVRPVGDTIVISPPLTLTSEQCEQIIEVLGESIDEVSNELSGENLIAA